MSTRRTTPLWSRKQRTGPDGHKLCLQCDKQPIPSGRRTFCSTDCADQWYIKTRPGFARRQVFARDGGVCAACALDTCKDIRERLERAGRRIDGWTATGHLWQADHIKPVAEGGGECSLDNLRTLCTACHKAATAALKKRLARARRDAQLPLLQETITT